MKQRPTICFALGLASAVLDGAAGSAGAEFRLKLADGREVTGAWVSWLPGKGLALRTQAGETLIPDDDLLALQRTGPGASAPREPGTATRLYFNAGGAASVQMLDAAPGLIQAKAQADQPLSAPFDEVAAVQFAAPGDCPAGDQVFQELRADRAPGEDVLVSCEGGEVRTVGGALEALGSKSGALRHADRSRTFQVSRLYGVVMARRLAAPPRPQVLATTVEGDVWPGDVIGSEGQNLLLSTPFAQPLTLDVDRIARLDFHNERVVYLSDLRPSAVSETGQILSVQPWRKDRSAANTPLRMSGVTYERGLGVHAHCALTYALDGRFQSFYALLGIDDLVRPRGSVRVIVKGDDRTLYDQGPLTGRDGSRPVRLDVTDVRALALIVECGEDLDVSDLFDWADARVIRPTGTAE